MQLTEIVFILIYLIGIFLIARKYRKTSRLFWLFVFVGLLHLTMSLAYYIISRYNPADAVGYYLHAQNANRPWLSFFGQDITFIVFLTYPFAKWFQFSYLETTLIYSFIGLLGFLLIIDVLRNLTFNKISLWYLLLLLPNLHFWTVAIGKDSLVFFSMSFLLYNIYFKKSWVYYLLPVFLIGFIRIHILVFAILAFGATQLFINKSIRVSRKLILLIALGILMVALMPMFADRLRINEERSIMDAIEYFDSIEAMGGSGVDMRGRNIVVKWLSFMFRPMFFDSHSILTLIASLENIVWLIMAYSIFKNLRKKLPNYLSANFWLSLFIVFAVSLPSAYGIYNLGIAMRQKYMIFPFFIFSFFVAIYRRQIIEAVNNHFRIIRQ